MQLWCDIRVMAGLHIFFRLIQWRRPPLHFRSESNGNCPPANRRMYTIGFVKKTGGGGPKFTLSVPLGDRYHHRPGIGPRGLLSEWWNEQLSEGIEAKNSQLER